MTMEIYNINGSDFKIMIRLRDYDPKWDYCHDVGRRVRNRNSNPDADGFHVLYAQDQVHCDNKPPTS